MKDEGESSLADKMRPVLRVSGKKAPEPAPANPVSELKARIRSVEERARRSNMGGPATSQAAGSAQKRDHLQRRKDIIIGLDFGTAFSKVVIQDPDARNAWAVPFGEIAASPSKFLLPTQLIGFRDGEVRLAGQGDQIEELKIQLMNAPESSIDGNWNRHSLTARHLCAIYLSEVLRMSRSWFTKAKADAYRMLTIDWHVNVGLPSSSLDDNNQLRVFEQVAHASWLLSLQDGPLSAKQSIEAVQESRREVFRSGIPADRMHVYPELAAEVTGYARSDLRRTGLHLMVDIGASTVDVSSFILFENDDLDNFSFLTAEVQTRGTLYLHRHRVAQLCKLIKTRPPEQEISKLLPNPSEQKDIDQEYAELCKDPVARALMETKTQRAPNEPQFRKPTPEQLPVFRAGGGSALPFYRDLMTSLERSFHQSTIIGRFDVQEIPRPRNLIAEGLRDSEYHRLAVAYGLSFRYMDLAAVKPPSQIDNIGTLSGQGRPDMVGKDQV